MGRLKRSAAAKQRSISRNAVRGIVEQRGGNRNFLEDLSLRIEIAETAVYSGSYRRDRLPAVPLLTITGDLSA